MTDTLRIEYTPLSALKRHPRNPKDHDNGAIAKSISRFGYVAPILMDERSGYIVAGHGRIDTLADMQAKGEAAPARIQVGDNGEWLVPVQRGVTFNSDSEVEAYLVADNRLTELGGWHDAELAGLLQDLANEDTALLEATGYDGDDLDNLLRAIGPVIEPTPDPGAQIDRAAELRKQWQTERGQVWQVGRHRIMCGDSTSAEDVARLMGGAKADAVVTDPPYAILGGGVSIAGKGIESSFDRQFFRSWFKEFYQTTTPNMMGISSYWFTIDWRGATAVEEALVGTKHRLVAVGVWNRGGLGMGYILRKTYENFVVIVSEGFERTKTDEPDVWDFQWTPGNRNFGHGAEKPVEIMIRAINLVAPNRVYDPFLGSGTTLVACEHTGRVGYGMEIDPAYVAVALQRLSDMGLEPKQIDKLDAMKT